MAAKKICPDDLMPIDRYALVRKEMRAQNIARKRNRRLSLGPDITFYFENYDTMWMQIHEMLLTEGGGAAQIDDELAAYNPLVPNGRELVATMMIEIEDENRRHRTLAKLGGLDHNIIMTIGGENILAQPEQDVERTTEEGKTSAVHFLHFPFTASQIKTFKDLDRAATIGCEHPEYGHIAVIAPAIRQELAGDLD